MDPIDSVANGDAVFRSLEEKAAADENLKGEETEKPDWQVTLAKAAAKMGPSDLADYLIRMHLPEYHACPWRDMFNDSSDFYHVIYDPLSHIPQSVYQTSVDWLDQHISEELLRGYVLWSFNHIICDLFVKGGGVVKYLLPRCFKPGYPCVAEVSIFVTLAMVVRSKPHVLTEVLPNLRLKPKYHGPGQIPLTVWLITQASRDNLRVGLYIWAHNLLPLALKKPQLRDLILKLVEKILATPDAQTILVNAPVWMGKRLIPPHSFEILMGLTFPDTSAREEATSRFEAIYPLLKKVALAGASGSEAEAITQIFTCSLKLSRQGDTLLAKEATAIAIWSLTENVECWKHWVNIFEGYLIASIALLTKLVRQCEDSTQGNEAMIQQIFNISLKLAGQGNLVLKATANAIWSLIIVVDYWKHRGKIYEEKLKDFLAVLKKLVENNDHSKASKRTTQNIFTFSLKVAGQGNPVLAKEATSIAVWSLTENIDCWKHWENIFEKNLKASIALLKRLVGQCKDGTLGSEAMIQQIFNFSLKLAGQGNLVLKATAFAIWSLTIVVDCWKHKGNIYEENLKACVALLKKIVEKWNDHSVTFVGSPGSKAMKQITRNIFTFYFEISWRRKY